MDNLNIARVNELSSIRLDKNFLAKLLVKRDPNRFPVDEVAFPMLAEGP